jgi:hypothetical protein
MHVVCRRGLLDIEGFAVRVHLDPDRQAQRTVLTTLGAEANWSSRCFSRSSPAALAPRLALVLRFTKSV